MAVVALVLVALPAGATGDSPSRGYQVVGGNVAPSEPWVAALALRRAASLPDGQYCAGSLIAPEWVVTAAHCVTAPAPTQPGDIRIVIGRRDLDGTDGDDNAAAAIYRHPGYSSDSFDNDVALIRLAHPSTQTPIRLVGAGESALTAAGSAVAVLGWGQINDDPSNPVLAMNLRSAVFTAFSDTYCDAFPGLGPAFNPSTMVCAGQPGVSACAGDSGGPLIALDDAQKFVLVGAVDFGPESCGTAPGVYAELVHHLLWIAGVLGVSAAPAPAPVAIPTPDVTRLSGTDRISTALAISRDAFADGAAGAVVIASAANFPDALVGVPLASARTAPILLTSPAGLDAGTLAEIDRVGAKTAYVLGGPAAVGSTVVDQLAGSGVQVVRYGGATRYETSVVVAQSLGAVHAVVEATGTSFADALTGGAAAAKLGGAVVLTAASSLPASVAGYVGGMGGVPRYAIGGAAAAADPGATPIVGADRFSTAAAVADRFFTGPTVTGVASGFNFPDALAGAAHAARRGGPLLLAGADTLPAAAVDYLRRHASSVGHAYVYGGQSAVANPVLAEIEAAIS